MGGDFCPFPFSFSSEKNIINVFKNGSHGYFDGKGGKDRWEGNA